MVRMFSSFITAPTGTTRSSVGPGSYDITMQAVLCDSKALRTRTMLR